MAEAAIRLAAAIGDRYRLERELGAGGMATVYLAHDLRHERKVAIKVLHAELSAVIGAERFLAEIKTTANLQHPHILGLIDSGAVDGIPFYVMPFVDGESLRDRLQRERQLPVETSIRIAREVADALAYAHSKGVVHRDVKPENVMLQDGHALVADFGIALAVQQAGGQRMTQTGLSLGTPAYMSPEQAMGERSIDARTDVYALGVVTYEMLAGDPPFTGPNSQAVVAKVLTERPPSLMAVRDTVPPHVEGAVLTALAKLRADRWESVRAFADALTNPTVATNATRVSVPPREAARNRWAIAGWVTAMLALAFAGWTWFARPQPASAPPARLRTVFAPGQELSTHIFGQRLALSADGSRLAYVGVAPNNQRQLWLRRRDALDAQVIPGTFGATGPVFSPNGEWIAFVADGKLRKVRVTGGDVETIADSANGTLAGAAWLGEEALLFTHADWTLHRVSAAGGPTTKVAGIGHAQGLIFPRALPRTDAVLYTTCSDSCDSMTVGVLNASTGEMTQIANDATGAWYAPTGHVVYTRRDGVVHARAFDVDRLTASGPAVPVIGRVNVIGYMVSELAMAPDGSAIYVEGTGDTRRFVRVDRTGKASVLDSSWAPSDLGPFAISADGRQLATTIYSGTSADIWVKQLDRGALTRLTVDGRRNIRPAWLSDGRIAYVTRDSGFAVHARRPDGTGQIMRVASPPSHGELEAQTWSPDGRWLVTTTRRVDDMDIRARLIGTDSVVDVAVAPVFAETGVEVSPDGKWVAYVSTETGRPEIYVRPFPDVARERRQVSNGGAYSPVWSRDGRELFFIDDAGRRLMTAPVTDRATMAFGPEQPLFSIVNFDVFTFFRGFDVMPDGRSFVFTRPESRDAPAHPVMVFNWLDELRRKVPR